jgi:hypothetical protein
MKGDTQRRGSANMPQHGSMVMVRAPTNQNASLRHAVSCSSLIHPLLVPLGQPRVVCTASEVGVEYPEPVTARL